MSRKTTDWYDREAETYKSRTDAADMDALYDRFGAVVKPPARVLDLGCGPGRDMAALAKRGYRVTGIDGAEGMVRLARERLGPAVSIRQSSFSDWQPEPNSQDAIWACASLLFIPPDQLEDTLAKAQKALKPGGVMYIALKHGDGQIVEEDVRKVWLWRKETLEKLMPGFAIDQHWISGDASPQRRETQWLNLLARKIEPKPEKSPERPGPSA